MAIYYNSKPVDVSNTYDPTSEDAISGKGVKQALDQSITGVYKPGGTVSFENLPALSSDVLGFVYNVSDDFVTDTRFVEGSGISCVAGTNAVVVNTGTDTNPVYKFDTLAVSSNSPSIDDTTITKNASDELQASAVMNARTGIDALPIWQGTQQQWTEGVGTDWYNWRTDLIYNKSSSSYRIRGSQLGYNGNTFVSIAGGFWLQYSFDDGSNWYQGGVSGISSAGYFVGSQVFWTGSEFIAYYNVGYDGFLFHSADGVTWTYTSAPRGGSDFAYYNGIYIVRTSSDEYSYSYSTNGTNWTSASLYLGSSRTLKVLNNQFVWVGSYNNAPSICTSTDGINWDRKALDFNAINIGYGNGLYVCPINGTNTLKYSTDLINWQETTLPITAYWTYTIMYGDGVFVINLSDSSNNFIYSSDGINWLLGTYTATGSNHRGVFGNNKFLITSDANAVCEILTFDQGSVYTLSTTPTTASTVYSEPNTTSALTITSVGTGTITLSDNNTYTYTQSGDEVTYQSIGEAHPTWLCNINGVGVKVGNTLIADNTDTSGLQPLLTAGTGIDITSETISTVDMQTTTNLVTSVSSASTDSQYPSAKLFYDTCGDIETLINNL